MTQEDDPVSGSRRRVIQSLGLVPLCVAAPREPAQAATPADNPDALAPGAKAYAPKRAANG